MTDDETISNAAVKAETALPEAERTEADLHDIAERQDMSGPRKGLGIAAICLGFMIALCAGGLGGFAAHEYFKTPLPDIPDFSQDIKTLEETISEQAAQLKQLEARRKAQTTKTVRNLKAVEDKWQEELRALDNKIKTASLSAAVPVHENPIDEPATSRCDENEMPIEALTDPRPELLAAVDRVRRRLNEDMAAIKTRLERLEAQAQRGIDNASGNVLAPQEPFPLQEIIDSLDDADMPATAQNWWNKLLRKHISVKRIDRTQAAARLRDIEAAILIQDWEQAQSLSSALPEPARQAVQEWIARARR